MQVGVGQLGGVGHQRDVAAQVFGFAHADGQGAGVFDADALADVRPTPSAAARKMSGAGLECATAAGSEMALKKWVSPMRSSRNGAKLSLLPQVFIWAKPWTMASHEPVIEVKPRYCRYFRES